MTAPEPTGPSRPGRVAGLALLGVALIALVLGIVTVVTGDGSGQAEVPVPPSPPASSEPGTTTNPTSQPGSPPPSPTASPPPSGSPTQPPAPPASSAPAPPPQTPSVKDQPVRVYNNSTIAGLANRAADEFRAQGWNVIEVGNYSQGVIPTSTAYFRKGTPEEAAAHALARSFGLRAEPRFQGITDAQPGIIVIVTNNYGGK